MLFKSFIFGALLTFSFAKEHDLYVTPLESVSTKLNPDGTLPDKYKNGGILGWDIFGWNPKDSGPDDPPNTLGKWNPAYQTAAVNATWMVVPVNKAAVEEAVYPYKLIKRLPTAVFPVGFPNGTHPVIVQSGYQNDLKQFNKVLMTRKLMAGSLVVPFVDKLKNGYTPFNFALGTYAGGVKNDFQGIGEATSSALTGTTVTLAGFDPAGPAYNEVDEGEYSAKMSKTIVPNPFGSGFQTEIVDLLFKHDPMPTFTNHSFHMMLNQPQILRPLNLALDLAQCFHKRIFFNETFSQPTFVTGNVTLTDALGIPGFAGVYENVDGFSATGQQIGYTNQDCKEAANNLDAIASA